MGRLVLAAAGASVLALLVCAGVGCASVLASDGLVYPAGVEAAKASAAHDLGCPAASFQVTPAGAGESAVYVVDGCGSRSTYQYKEQQTFHAGNKGEVVLVSRLQTGPAPSPPGSAAAMPAPLPPPRPALSPAPAPAPVLDGCSKDVDCKGMRVCVKMECVSPPPTQPCRVDGDAATDGG